MGLSYEYGTDRSYANIPREQVPLRAVWRGFKDKTTAHGVHHTKHARGRGFLC